MQGVELEEDLRSFPQLPVWIIEHVWARRVMDIQRVVDSSLWPDVGSQPLSLEESWRLRVSSARAYSLVKNRDLPRFESVIAFLETTHRLVPGLVKAIRHMKIVFGLKTLIVMRMLRDGCSAVDTSLKILSFFPSDLPAYRGLCSPREMFLMRKNHLDFRVLAQVLATDDAKRQYYVENHLDQQYGEAYAQKVEERLLQYLLLLEPALPRDTRVDQVGFCTGPGGGGPGLAASDCDHQVRRKSPESEEERLLLRVISEDAVTIATTLERLLCGDAASCRLVSASRPPDDRARHPGEPVAVRDSEKRNNEEQRGRVRCCDLKASSSSSSSSAPQFCSRHQRWVQSILSECPAECSDPVLKPVEPISPPLFQSSPSSSSSQDLTPSGLLPLPPHRRELFLHDDSLPLGSSSPSPGVSGATQPLPSLVPTESVLLLTVPDSDLGSSSSSWRQGPVESEPSSHLSPSGSAQLDASREDVDSLLVPEHPCDSEPPGSALHSPLSDGPIPPLSDTISPDPDSLAARSRIDQLVQLRLSMQTQQVLLCSKLLQPRVSVSRLEVPDCYRPVSPGEPGSGDETEDQESSFDMNDLFTDSSSTVSDSQDLDYQPSRKKPRKL